MMRLALTGITATLAAAIGGILPAAAQEDSEDRAVLHFADMRGAIRGWRPADDGEALLIEGRNDEWFRATFRTPCLSLRHATAIAFVTEPATGNLDRFGSVIAEDERCYFDTLERTADPDAADD